MVKQPVLADPAVTAPTADVERVADWRPDVVRAVGDLYEVLDTEVAALVVETCRRRIAAILGHTTQEAVRSPRAVRAGLTAEMAARIEQSDHAPLGEPVRSSLQFADAYCRDPSTIREPLRRRLERRHGRRMFMFAEAVSIVDRFQRVTLFVDSVVTGRRRRRISLVARPALDVAGARSELEAITRAPRDLDPVTRELARLRNAEFQNCNH